MSRLLQYRRWCPIAVLLATLVLACPVLGQVEDEPPPAIPVEFRDVSFQLPEGNWEPLGQEEPQPRPWIGFARTDALRTQSIVVTEVAASSVLSRAELAAKFFRTAQQEGPLVENFTDFREGTRRIGDVDYPTMSFRGELASSGDGLYIVYFPADFELRERFFALLWTDIHAADTPSVPEDFDALVTSLSVRPVGTILLADDFEDEASGVLPSSSPDPEHYLVGYGNGEYAVRKVDAGWTQVAGAVAEGTFADVTVRVNARVVESGRDGGVAVYCRWDAAEETGYRLRVEPARGRFILERRDVHTAETLVGWRSSGAIRTGEETNRIELTCRGSTLEVAINGTRLASVRDDTYREGSVRLGVGAPPGATVEGRFDNLVVTQR